MSKVVLGLCIIMMISVTAFAESRTVKQDARNSSGKLLYRTKTIGNVTEVRDPSGKLISKSRSSGNKTEVRSPTGRLIKTIRREK